ncbi:MAG: hypothetical protein MRZ79_19490 [Bacteroidia bacterium]|nr:hypothetical protein [Bacteroidia bacterium]
MWEDFLSLVSNVEFWKFASIPFISAIVGWGTNVLALKMTFYPLEFIGLGKLGWQGIIPSKAGEMAGKAVDLLTKNLITIEDRFEQIDPERVAEEIEPALNRLSIEVVNDTMERVAPVLWESAPAILKERFFQRMSEGLPEAVEELMEDVKMNITELFDLKAMVIEALESDRELLNQIFLRVGDKEFRFIEQSGLYFGFFFGIFQMSLFLLLQLVLNVPQAMAAWTLPVAGLLVGWATNVLALRMIFVPLRPRRFGPFVFQGLFIKRQSEVAAAYARIISQQILTSEQIFDKMIHGPSAPRLQHLLQLHVKKAVDGVAGLSKPLFQLAQGTKKYVQIKTQIAAQFVEGLPRTIKYIFKYTEEALDIENTLRTRMQGLGPVEFVSFLRPVFQKDEWKLILVGALLGLWAGFMQLLFVFGGELTSGI